MCTVSQTCECFRNNLELFASTRTSKTRDKLIFVNNLWSKMDENVNCLTKVGNNKFLPLKCTFLVGCDCFWLHTLHILPPFCTWSSIVFLFSCVFSFVHFLFQFLLLPRNKMTTNLFTESNDCLLIFVSQIIYSQHQTADASIFLPVAYVSQHNLHFRTFTKPNRTSSFNQKEMCYAWTRCCQTFQIAAAALVVKKFWLNTLARVECAWFSG